MAQTAQSRFVGLDVHAETIAIAVADRGRAKPITFGVIPNKWPAVEKALRKLGGSKRIHCCYEAGPTGYGLYRSLAGAGYSCEVVAPSLVPVQPGKPVKTDRLDALRLARFLRGGELTAIAVPDEETEALRDLVRARADSKKQQKIARQLLSMFLLRYGRSFPGKTNWTQLHYEWIGAQVFEHEAQRRVLADHLQAAHDSTERVKRLSDDIEELVQRSTLKPLVAALKALKGVDTIAAATLLAELGDLRRFPSPKQLMSYVGLTPCEHSSGASQRRGGISKAGNAEARRVLTESAWAYRWPPRLSRRITRRCPEVDPAVRAIAWKAQHRLHGRYCRMLARGKDKKKTIIAIARELTGFIWAVVHAASAAQLPRSSPASRASSLRSAPLAPLDAVSRA